MWGVFVKQGQFHFYCLGDVMFCSLGVQSVSWYMIHQNHLQFFKYPEVKNMFCLVFGCGMSHFTHRLLKLFASPCDGTSCCLMLFAPAGWPQIWQENFGQTSDGLQTFGECDSVLVGGVLREQQTFCIYFCNILQVNHSSKVLLFVVNVSVLFRLWLRECV